MSDDQGHEEGQDGSAPAPAAVRPGTLVHLIDHEPHRPERVAAELRACWEGLRKGRAVPARSEIEPRAIRRVLDHAFILERIAPGAARFRLAGRHLIDVLGMEVRGMPVCALLETRARGRFSDVLETVFRGPQIAQVALSSAAGYGRPAMTGVLLLLPLRSDLGDVTRALGCLATTGGIGQTPRRFDILADQVFPVIPGAQVIEPSPSTTGFAEPAAPWSTRLARERGPRPPVEPATPEERRACFRLISADPEPPDPGRRM